MSQLATQQLDSIHSMLSAGHRSLRMERHSLILWGLSCGGLILISDNILTSEQFPELQQRALAWLLLLVLIVSGVGLVDWQLMRRVKQARDETLSFIHRQVIKVWWLLMALGVLLTFATFFYGGGYMVLAAWLVLAGVGLYVHGLFSEELLEWVGAFIIAIGIGMLVFRLNYTASQWIASSTLGIGLPLLANMLDHGRTRPSWVRLAQSLGWLVVVLIPPLIAKQLQPGRESIDLPVVTFEQFQHNPDAHQVVTLPAGSRIPLRLDVSGNIFRTEALSSLELTLNEPVQIVMEQGKPSGDWRFAWGEWSKARESYWIQIPWIKTELSPQTGPELYSRLIVETRHSEF